MANKLDWSKAKKERPDTHTAATKFLEHRADRYLEVALKPKPTGKPLPRRTK